MVLLVSKSLFVFFFCVFFLFVCLFVFKVVRKVLLPSPIHFSKESKVTHMLSHNLSLSVVILLTRCSVPIKEDGKVGGNVKDLWCPGLFDNPSPYSPEAVGFRLTTSASSS